MHEKILNDSVNKIIKDLTIPSYIGMLGMNIFNIVDTYFVASLGIEQLSAMSFTFSIIMFVNLITIGLGVAMASLLTKAVGTRDEKLKSNIIVSGLVMSLILSIFLSVVGFFTIDPLFKLLGANSTTLPYIEQYMQVWYTGCIFLFLSMVGTQIFRGLGNTKTPAYLLLFTILLNVILDPILIFGLFSFPELGISGAALATVISRFLTFILYYLVLHKKYDIFKFKGVDIKTLVLCSKNIFKIAWPNCLTKVSGPIINAIMTTILASQSQLAVAGFGVGSKLSSIFLALAIALGNTAMIIIGQNYGAKQHNRVEETFNSLNKFCLIIFSFIYIFIFFSAPFLAQLFTNNEEIISIIVLYLRIIPLAYPMQSIFIITTSLYNILNKPIIGTILRFSQVLLIILPFSYLIFLKFGIAGLFILLTISQILISLISLFISKQLIKKISFK